jgi:hypothetical protein
MTLDMRPHSRGAMRPSFASKFIRPSKRGRREGRVLSSHPWPVCKKGSTRGRTTGAGGIIRPSLRNGFNGLFRALPGDRAFLPPSPLRSLLIRNLMPASGHQNHTTSPSAAAPLVMRRCRVHCIPHPTSVTTRTPLVSEAGRRINKAASTKRRSEIFFLEGLDTILRGGPAGQISCSIEAAAISFGRRHRVRFYPKVRHSSEPANQ